MIDGKFGVVVMAGGFGSRLAPMTNSRPKPLLPVYNRSAFERILDLLGDNGFSEAAVTTMYLPDQLEKITHEKVRLTFFREDKPKGSAGAVRALYERLADTVLIISGDSVCDFDLRKQVELHKKRKSSATMLLSKTKTPQEFGTVLKNPETGIITRFLEKPSWADTLSNLINTGIYILKKSIIELIPVDGFFDFGKDLFPLIMEKGTPIYGEEAEGSWCDIGSFGEFYSCNMCLSGGVNIAGSGCEISKDAKIAGSILFEDVKVGYSEITNSIICENVTVGSGCVISEGCVIGANSVIGDRAFLTKGVKVADNIKIGRGARIMGNVFFSTASRHLFGDEGISGIYGREVDGELCFKLGQGLCVLGKPARIGVMSDGSQIGNLLADSVKTGVHNGGGYMLELEEGFLELAAFAPREYSLDCCVFISVKGGGSGDYRADIYMLEQNGLFFSHEKQRKIENAMREKPPVPEIIYKPRALTGEDRIKFRYCLYLQALAGPLRGIRAAAGGDEERANFFFSNARELGADTEMPKHTEELDRDIFLFDGRDLSALSAKKRELSYWQLFMLAAQSGGRNELYLPQSTPEGAEVFLRQTGLTLHFYNDSESDIRKKAFDTHFAHDNVLLALLVCRYLRENNVTLDQAAVTLPPLFIRSLDIEVDEEEKADIIGSLASECEDCSRGVRIHTEKGSVAVFPRADGGFRVLAEAVSSESAEELCDFAEKKIKKGSE